MVFVGVLRLVERRARPRPVFRHQAALPVAHTTRVAQRALARRPRPPPQRRRDAAVQAPLLRLVYLVVAWGRRRRSSRHGFRRRRRRRQVLQHVITSALLRRRRCWLGLCCSLVLHLVVVGVVLLVNFCRLLLLPLAVAALPGAADRLQCRRRWWWWCRMVVLLADLEHLAVLVGVLCLVEGRARPRPVFRHQAALPVAHTARVAQRAFARRPRPPLQARRGAAVQAPLLRLVSLVAGGQHHRGRRRFRCLRRRRRSRGGGSDVLLSRYTLTSFMESRIGLSGSGGDSGSWISCGGGCCSRSEMTVVLAVAGGGRCTCTFSGSTAGLSESKIGWISCAGATGCSSSETTVVVAVAG